MSFISTVPSWTQLRRLRPRPSKPEVLSGIGCSATAVEQPRGWRGGQTCRPLDEPTRWHQKEELILFSLTCIPCKQASWSRWTLRTLRNMPWMVERITRFQSSFQSGTEWDRQFRKPVDSLLQWREAWIKIDHNTLGFSCFKCKGKADILERLTFQMPDFTGRIKFKFTLVHPRFWFANFPF